MKGRLNVIKLMYRKLKLMFPNVKVPNRSALNEAIFAVLSQNTRDDFAQRCLDNLRKLTKDNLLELKQFSREAIIENIKLCGMYKHKSIAIINIVSNWKLIEGLKFLPSTEVIKSLNKYPYIGPKTARLIATFSLGKNAFPVDTHVDTVLKRIGLFKPNDKKEAISVFMEKNFTGKFNRIFHLLLINFGKRICTKRNPKCRLCPFNNICSFYLSSFRLKGPYKSREGKITNPG